MCFNQPNANLARVRNLYFNMNYDQKEISNFLDSSTAVCYTGALGFEGVDTSTSNSQVTEMYLHKAALTFTFLQDWSQSNLSKE